MIDTIFIYDAIVSCPCPASLSPPNNKSGLILYNQIGGMRTSNMSHNNNIFCSDWSKYQLQTFRLGPTQNNIFSIGNNGQKLYWPFQVLLIAVKCKVGVISNYIMHWYGWCGILALTLNLILNGSPFLQIEFTCF